MMYNVVIKIVVRSKFLKKQGEEGKKEKRKKGTDENLKWEAREERGDEYAPGKKKDLEIKASQ